MPLHRCECVHPTLDTLRRLAKVLNCLGAGGITKRRITVAINSQLIHRASWVAKHYDLSLVARFERGFALALWRYPHTKRLKQVHLRAGRKKIRRI